MHYGTTPKCFSHCWRITWNHVDCFKALIRKLKVMFVEKQVRNSAGFRTIESYEFYSIWETFNVQPSPDVSY